MRCCFDTNRNEQDHCKQQIYLYTYTVTSKGQLNFLTSGQGQKVTQLGHVAYHLMHLDKGNILKPAPRLYLISIKSYKEKRTLTSWRHYLTSNNLAQMQSCTEVIKSILTEHGSERVEQIW